MLAATFDLTDSDVEFEGERLARHSQSCYGWTRTAVVAGCIAAVAPVANRWLSAKLTFAPRTYRTNKKPFCKQRFEMALPFPSG